MLANQRLTKIASVNVELAGIHCLQLWRN